MKRPAKLSSTLLALTAFVAIGLFWGTKAQASIFHVVRTGDTVNSLAMEYYGEANRATLLRAVNRMPEEGEVELAIGEPLLIPESARRVVKTGETWADLAQAELGSPDRAWYIADINGAEESSTPTKGQIINIPYLMPWSLTEGLAGTVSHFFPDQSGRDRIRIARLLIKLNSGLRPRGMTRGTRIIIPFADLNILPEKRAELDRIAALRRSSADQQAQTQATAQLEELGQLYAQGDYLELIRTAGHIAGASELTAAQQVTLHRYLGQTFVALDRVDLAEREFAELLELQPDFQFDQVTTSPVILELFQRVRRERGSTVNQR